LLSEGILALTAVRVDPNQVAEVITAVRPSALVDLEELIIRSFSPLVAGKIAILLHVRLCGWHYSNLISSLSLVGDV
jgi:hypothetical protein